MRGDARASELIESRQAEELAEELDAGVGMLVIRLVMRRHCLMLVTVLGLEHDDGERGPCREQEPK